MSSKLHDFEHERDIKYSAPFSDYNKSTPGGEASISSFDIAERYWSIKSQSLNASEQSKVGAW